MKRTVLLILAVLAVLLVATAGCPVKKLEVERLPDMLVPRATHCAFCINGELVAIGGHTTGFKLTQSAEYFSGGKWHEMTMVYDHDFGAAARLPSGKILIAGGVEKSFGIGQSYSAEFYDPETHTFESTCILYKKRAQLSATALQDGRVVVAGNWFRGDLIEVFDGHASFDSVKPVSTSRTCPLILRTAPDDVIIIGSVNSWNEPLADSAAIVDHLKGDPISIHLLQQWHPVPSAQSGEVSFIGDEAKGDYSYLLPMVNDEGQVAIVGVHNGDFTLLPTDFPVPMTFAGDTINYYYNIIADRNVKRAYLLGGNKSGVLCCVVAIDYSHPTATLLLYGIDAQYKIPYSHSLPVLTPDGNLVIVGGAFESNFDPQSSVFLLRTGTGDDAALQGGGDALKWLWAILAVLAVSALAACLWKLKSRRRRYMNVADAPVSDVKEELFNRICQLMEQEKLFLNGQLKLGDVAARLGENSRNVSDCIKKCRGCSFTQFVNGYRVEYAKELLVSAQDTKISVIALEAGFSNETSFFRTFKTVTGMTPKEWLAYVNEQG